MTRHIPICGLAAALVALLLGPTGHAQERTVDARPLDRVKLKAPEIHGGFKVRCQGSFPASAPRESFNQE